MSNDTMLFAKQARVFCSKYGTMSKQIRAAVEAQDFDGASALLHTLRGMSSALGADVLAKDCLEIEQRVKAKDVSSLTELIQTIEVKTEQAMNALLDEAKRLDPL